MAVTLSERVYNPATALGSLGRAGGRLSSRVCHSAGTWCCQHPDARSLPRRGTQGAARITTAFTPMEGAHGQLELEDEHRDCSCV